MTGVLKAEFCQLEKEEKGSQGQGTRRGGPARGHAPRRGWAPGASGGVGSQAPRTLQGPNLPQRLWGPGQGSCSGSGPYATVRGRGRGRQVRGLPLRSQTVRRAGRGEGVVPGWGPTPRPAWLPFLPAQSSTHFLGRTAPPASHQSPGEPQGPCPHPLSVRWMSPPGSLPLSPRLHLLHPQASTLLQEQALPARQLGQRHPRRPTLFS